MIIRSFQIKMILWSTLLSGGVLAAFGLFFLHAIYSAALDQTDQEILSFGETRLHSSLEQNEQEDIEQSLRFIYGENSGKKLAIKVFDARGQENYSSANWPDEISRSNIPLPLFDTSKKSEPKAASRTSTSGRSWASTFQTSPATSPKW